MPFKMSEHYKHQRDVWIKHFVGWFNAFQGVSFIVGAIAIFVPFIAYARSADSKGNGQWNIGYQQLFLSVMYCHSLFWTFFKNINWVICMALSILYVLLFITSALQQRIVSSELYMQIIPEVWADPLQWLVLLVTFVAMVLPLVFFRAWRDIIRFPKYNI